MPLLFNINKKGTILFHPDAVNLCPELQPLKDNDKLFIVLYCDYYSPFAQLPEQDRLNKSLLMVYKNTNKDLMSKEIIKNAIEAYNALQYDPVREMLKSYNKKLELLSDDLMAETNSRKINELLSSQSKIRNAIREINEEVSEKMEMDYHLKGGGKLSFIELLMRNKDEYDRVTKRREGKNESA